MNLKKDLTIDILSSGKSLRATPAASSPALLSLLKK